MDEATLPSRVEGGDGHRAVAGPPSPGTASAQRRRRAYSRFRIAVDALMLTAAALAVVVSSPGADVPVEGWGWLTGFCVLTLILIGARFGYRMRTVPNFLEDARLIVAASAIAALSIAFVRVLVADDPWVASQTTREWVFAAVYLIGGRTGLHLAETAARRRGGAGLTRVVIVGAGEVGHLIARRLLAKPELGLRPVGFVDADPLEVANPAPLPVLGTETELEPLVLEHDVHHAIFSFSRTPHDVQLPLVRRLEQLGVTISIIPRLFEGVPDRMTLDRVEGLPLVSIYPSDPQGWQFALKYAFDRLLALVAIVLLSPLLLVAAVGVLVSMGRPVIFRQRRVGLDGREFDLLKFRTMAGSPDQEGEADAGWAAGIAGSAPAAAGDAPGSDRRIPRFGRLLRRWALDELPQLFNVLRGQMSVVGPRPERRSYVDLFEKSVRRYAERHRVKAGLTGWAQVHGLRGETSLVDRVEWDNYYIENWSLWLDVKILLMTVVALFRDRPA